MVLEPDYKNVNLVSSLDLYNDSSARNRTSSTVSSLQNKVAYSHLFKAEEVGITHPILDSVVKIQNNGDINLFVEGNAGISISKKLQIVSIYANRVKEHLHSRQSWLEGNYEMYVRGKHKTKVFGHIEMVGEKDYKLTINNDILASAKNLTINIAKDVNLNVKGNVNAKVNQHVKMDVDKDISIKSKGNIEIIAKGSLVVDGSTIDVGI